MSSLKLKHSGGNSVIIAAPSSNPAADRTITLPSTDSGTLLTTTNPKPGNVIQVVSAIKTGEASTTSDTMADTGLSASITPSATSSKILVQVCHPARIQRSGEYEGYGGFDLLRDSTVIYEAAKRSGGGYSGFMVSMVGSNSGAQMRSNYNLTVMDSPSSTSSLTYKTQYAMDYSSQLYINPEHGDSNYTPHSTIVLMEVAG